MGYYMRFITTDPKPSSIDVLGGRLRSRNPGWRLESEAARRPSAKIHLGHELLGELEVNQPGDGLFDEEVEELLELIEADGRGDRERVVKLLEGATAAYVVRVLWQGREAEDTLDALDAVWEILFELHDGLLQADAEGYYSREGQVLEVR